MARVKILDRFFAARSLQGKFLAIAIPLVCVTTFALFAIWEAYAYRTAVRELRSGLATLVATQSAALSNPLWNLDEIQIERTLEAITIDPDVVGARVFDETASIVSNSGVARLDQAPIRAEHAISFNDGGEQRVIGKLVIAMTDARVWASLVERFLLAGVLAIVVVLCVVASVLLAHRRTIGTPLERLLASINLAQTKKVREPVSWPSEDEMGAVISAFNEMQTQQAAYEGELRTARDTLEQRVEERTAELAAASDEAKTAQQQLTDAIETISEGFSLFDPGDRLVICNSRYHELLYPGMSSVMVPGTPFETIIRKAAELDLVRDVHNHPSIDDWVAARLELHREPVGPYVQQRANGRWIRINERRTENGSYVAVYSDITELKEREVALEEARNDLSTMLEMTTEHADIVEEELHERAEELTDKSNAMQQLSKKLSKYLSPQIYDSIFHSEKEVQIASTRKKLTVFFSDIAGFTETVDKLESEELTELLNHYLTEMTQIALKHGATIDKYVGDAIMIFFGDPETKGVKEDALACVQMAIAMRKRMEELQKIWRASGIEKPLRCRMGIHTDYCTVGNFGSDTRMDYTIIGGGVNLAARLESAATPGEILISYETYAQVSDQIFCNEHGAIHVKGIAYPVVTYEVVDHVDNLSTDEQPVRVQYPHLTLDLSPAGMTEDERHEATELLRQALNRLEHKNTTGVAA
ncbi:MAG: PAS-domain containing protein, partial [Alphaproteobacteria bacterium]|nr:PAS-domain containing protein [Alphaproteobacteria bacterium]